jgi:hypothetical protein
MVSPWNFARSSPGIRARQALVVRSQQDSACSYPENPYTHSPIASSRSLNVEAEITMHCAPFGWLSANVNQIGCSCWDSALRLADFACSKIPTWVNLFGPWL